MSNAKELFDTVKSKVLEIDTLLDQIKCLNDEDLVDVDSQYENFPLLSIGTTLATTINKCHDIVSRATIAKEIAKIKPVFWIIRRHYSWQKHQPNPWSNADGFVYTEQEAIELLAELRKHHSKNIFNCWKFDNGVTTLTEL